MTRTQTDEWQAAEEVNKEECIHKAKKGLRRNHADRPVVRVEGPMLREAYEHGVCHRLLLRKGAKLPELRRGSVP